MYSPRAATGRSTSTPRPHHRQSGRDRQPRRATELDLLHEVGRIREPALPVLDHLEATIGLLLSPVAFPSAVAAARALRWTRDPFDRLIVASALVDGAELASADPTIRANYPFATWD